MTKLELEIAWRYLRSRRSSRLVSLISVIAIGGVLVGVSALIVIMGVMNGLQNDLREKILVGSPDIRVLTVGGDLTMPDWRNALQRVRRTQGVVGAAPVVLTQALVSKAGFGFTTAAQVVGIEPQAPGVAEPTSIRSHADQGDFRFASADGRRRGAVLGKTLATQLNVWPGQKITLVGKAGVKINAVTGTPVPTYEEFEVTGIFDTGMYEYDNSYLYISLEAAQQFAGLDTAVTGLEVRTVDRWDASGVSRLLESTLGYPYWTQDWQTLNSTLFQALKLEKLGMGIILGLIIIVAAFNIVSTLTMVVTDKTREIGILKAMGLPARSVRRIFFLQGLVIGVVGTFMGVALGMVASVALEKYHFIKLDPAVYMIDHLPVTTEPLDVLAITLASVAIAALATLYPAMQAARLYPLEAIRHE